MKHEYTSAIRDKASPLANLSAVFLLPLLLFSGFRPLLPEILESGVLGTLVIVGLGVWAQFLPFAAFHFAESRDVAESRRLAMQDIRLVVGFLLVQFAISIAIAVPVVVITVIASLIGSGDSGLPSWWTKGLVFGIAVVMLLVRYRLLITPCVALTRQIPVRTAARCSNSVIGQRRRDLAGLYVSSIAGPELVLSLLTIIIGSPLWLTVLNSAVRFVTVPLSAILMLVAASRYSEAISMCPPVDSKTADEGGEETSEPEP